MALLSSRAVLLGTALSLSCTTFAMAQTQDQTALFLGTVILTDTRAEGTALDALAGISTVDQDTLDRAQPRSVAEVLGRLPGVGAVASGDDASVAVNIRGLQQMGRVVVTIDGARQDFWRVGHGSGSFYIDPDLLKQVTVIRGPSANAYGSGAIGGVVAFETRDPEDMLKQDETWAFSQRLRYGSNGEGWSTTSTGAARLSDRLSVIGSVSWKDSDPYKDGNGNLVRWTGERITSGLAKAVWRPMDGHELKFSVQRQDTDDVISGSSGSTSATLSRYQTETISDTINLAYHYRPDENGPIDLTVKAYRTSVDNMQDQVWPASAAGNSRFYNVSTNGVSFQNTTRTSAGGWDHLFLVGGDYALIKGASDADHFGGGRQELWGAFVQWQGNSGPLEVIASLRHDSYRLEGMSKTSPTAAATEVSANGNRISPRVSLGYDVTEGLQLFATYSEGYRSPHMQEMFRRNGSHGAGYEPNLGLRPEVAKSWELGANIQFDSVIAAGDSLRGKITAFNTDVSDYIETTTATSGATTYANVGDAKLKGVEIEGAYDFGRGWIDLSTSLVDAELESGATLSNTPLNNVTARLGLRAFGDRLEYGLEYQHYGDVTRQLSTGAVEYPKVDLVNLFATWSETDSYRVDFGVENVFDKAWTDPQSGWSTTSDLDQAAGRTFRVGFTKRFGG